MTTSTNSPETGRFSNAHVAGLRAFPLRERDKKPLGPWKSYQENAASPEDITSWDMSSFNVGIVTGRPSGVLVLDIDSPEAAEFVATLDLPLTAAVRTGRGTHMYFRHPGVEIGNSVAIGGHKLDFRGDGGYVVGAGSVHPSGAKYEWVHRPEEVGFANLPRSVLDLLQPARRVQSARARSGDPIEAESRFSKWLTDKLEEAKADLAGVREGGRNNALFLAGVKLAREVAGAGAAWEPFADELTKVALTIGLTADEAIATLASCWSAGSAEPTLWMVTAREWVYLGKQDAFYHLASGQFLKREGFNNTFASQRVAKGPFGQFLTAGQYITIVYDLTYEPGSTELMFERDGLLWLNTYRAPGIEATPGDTTQLTDFLAYLIPDEAEREHLLRVMAWTIRNPGKKVRHAIMIRSEHQGIGKSMLAGLWKAMLGNTNARTVSSEEIASDYQSFLQESLLNIVEELALGTGRQFYNRMKDWITGDVVRINEKHLVRREWPSMVTFLILTNLKVPILIEDKDRRFFMIDTPSEPRSATYYKAFASWWQSNLGVVRAYFDEIDLADFDPYAQPPLTAAKQLLIADSRTDLEKDLALLIKERSGAFNRDLVTLEEVEKELGRSMYGKSKTQLMNAMIATGAFKLGQKWVAGLWVDQLGFRSAPKRRISLWAIRNARFWQFASAQDCAAEYGRHSGFFAQWEEPALEFMFEHLKVRISHMDDLEWADRYFVADTAGAEKLRQLIEQLQGVSAD